MNVDDHKVTASCLHAHDVVSALASDHVCYHRLIRQEVLVDTYSRTTCVRIIQYESAI